MMFRLTVIISVILLFTGCASWNLGTVERLAANIAAQELGIEFAKDNPKLAEASVAYLEMTVELAQTDGGYKTAIALGLSKLMDMLDGDQKARYKPLMEEIAKELNIADKLDDDIKEALNNVDMKMLISMVSGFKSGLEYQLGK